MNNTIRALFVSVLLLAPSALRAQYTYITNGDGESVTLAAFSGGGNVVMPATGDGGLPITAIGTNAFYNNSNLTSIIISANIGVVSNMAFARCYNLTNASIPLSVTNIGSNAFRFTGLTNVIIPESVVTLNALAFANTPLTNIFIPASVTNITGIPFYQVTNLQQITVDPSNAVYTSSNGVLFGGGATTLIEYPCGLGGNYVIPDGVETIGNNAFYFSTNLATVTIPPSVETVGTNAFSLCSNLTSITIGAGLTTIDIEAFAQCASLTNVCFQGNASSNFSASAFNADPLTNIFYVIGTTGWGTNYDNLQVAGIPLTPCAECADVISAIGSVQVTLNPTNVTTDGAQWRLDDGPGQNSGATIYNIAAGQHKITFGHINGWSAPPNQTIIVSSNQLTTATGVYTAGTAGTLTVNIQPSAAVLAGAQWEVNGGPALASGASTNLSAGQYTLSFTSIDGWNKPFNQTVAIYGGAPTVLSGIYTMASNLTIVLLTNGSGKITHSAWPASLVVGKPYKVTAVPAANNVFIGWIGGANQPLGLLSSSVNYSFTFESNLVLEANFATNVYKSAAGAYAGLFGPDDITVRKQSNSGAFAINLTAAGAFSGSLNLGGQKIALSGKMDSGGATSVNTKSTKTAPALAVSLQMDFVDQSVSGTVGDDSFTATLLGNRNVFNAANKAANYEGQYTVAIPGTNDPAIGPFGNSYGTVKISPTGAIAFAGSLADGTAVSQSAVVSADGYWPVYISLYGGQGSLWGWNQISTNGILSAPALSWINMTNKVKTAVYRSGFTNDNAMLVGALFNPKAAAPTNLIAELEQTSPPFSIILTNLAGNTNKLVLKTNKTTGVITGTFLNPNNSKQTLKINGVLLQGLDEGAGYFLTTNQSGSFTMVPPPP